MEELIELSMKLAKMDIHSCTIDVDVRLFAEYENMIGDKDGYMWAVPKSMSIVPAMTFKGYGVNIVIRCTNVTYQ